MDPITRDDYNPYTKRDPNPERIEQIKAAAEQWAAATLIATEARRVLDDAIIEGHQTGHSFRQLCEASGISVASIQKLLAKRGIV